MNGTEQIFIRKFQKALMPMRIYSIVLQCNTMYKHGSLHVLGYANIFFSGGEVMYEYVGKPSR